MHPSPLSPIINGVRMMVAKTLVFSKMVIKTLIFGLQDDGQDGDFDDHDGVVDGGTGDDKVLTVLHGVTWCYMVLVLHVLHGVTW